MRVSGMQATCRAVFCQINSSPKRKRHWVGCTWPVSMYASGLCVATAPSRRWEWNTLSLSPAIEWRNLNHVSSFRLQFCERQKKKKTPGNICCLETREELALCDAKEGTVFLSQHCGCHEPASAGKLQSDTLVRYKTLSYCSKNHFFYWPMYHIQRSKD